MAKSLIEELPRIASEGRQEAQRIIERLSSGTRIGLQTNGKRLRVYTIVDFSFIRTFAPSF